MKLGVLKVGDSVPRAVWRSLDPLARLTLVVNGDVELDAEGRPIIRGEMLARVVADIDRAICEAHAENAIQEAAP